MEGNIIFFDEQKNNSNHTLKRITQSASSFDWRWSAKGLFGTAIIFMTVFYLINADATSFWIKIQSYWRADSLRKMEISDEWVAKYNIILNDKMKITDDADRDNLNFQEEQHYNTHPFQADTDGDGMVDSEEIKSNSNPLGRGELDNDQDGMPDAWEKNNGLNSEINDAKLDSDNDELDNFNEYAHGTNPQNEDSDSDGYADHLEIKSGYDPDAPGDIQSQVVILSEKIKLVAPVIWSRSEEEKDLQKDLESGVIHYPQSGVPGEKGNMIIAGHSSNYVWAEGDYNSVFRNLNSLEIGDKLSVWVSQQNGKTFEYHYIVKEKRVVNPDDEWVFEFPEEGSWITLSTCWPIGTDLSRLAVRAELI